MAKRSGSFTQPPHRVGLNPGRGEILAWEGLPADMTCVDTCIRLCGHRYIDHFYVAAI